MPDILAINATITAIKHSIDIAKAIKDADSTLEKAELKLKIAELIESLADAKISATEFQDVIQEKDSRIAELEDLLKFKDKLVRKDGMWFKADENGEPIDEPFCSNCWDSERKAIHLNNRRDFFECPWCKNKFINPNKPKRERPQLKIIHLGISRFSRR